MAVAVLVPIKAFGQAKRRLAGHLSPDERIRLATYMAARVVAAAGDLPVYVVCDDEHVASWARRHDAEPLWRPEMGLNGAVTSGVDALGAAGFDRVIVSHADLPLANDLSRLAQWSGVTLVPDRRDDGTNVAVVPTASGFTFGYGAGSFRRHGSEAIRRSLPLRVVRSARLGWDVDVPADLDHDELRGLLPSLPTSPANPR